MAAYSSSRGDDTRLERHVSDFLNSCLYSKLSSRGIPCVRRTDARSQFAGIDITVGKLNIDEKVKVRGGYVSRILDYPSFEISFKSQYDGSITDGWFGGAQLFWGLAVVSAALFSAAHYIAQPWPDAAFLALFFFGLAQTWLYAKTKRIWCAMLNHALFNLTNLVLLFVVPQS